MTMHKIKTGNTEMVHQLTPYLLSYFKKMYGSLKFKKLHQITKFKNVQLPQNQGCRVLVFCGTPTPGLENLGLQTPTLDSGPKKT